MRHDELDDRLERALRTMPVPRAPDTLLPRVLAAAGEWTAHRPWYRRPWLNWPLLWQAASLALLAALVTGGTFVLPLARTAALETATAIFAPAADAGVVPQLESAAEGTNAAAVVLWTFWRVVLVPAVAYATAVVALMCAACALFAVMVSRLAPGKALSR